MINPFEAPQAKTDASVPEAFAGPWRDGDRVVAESGRRWPARCVQCDGERDLVPVRVGSRSAPGVEWAVIFLLGPIAWAYWWLRVRGRGTVLVYACPEHRWRPVLLRAAVVLGSIAVGIGGMGLAAVTDDPRLLVVPLGAVATGFLWWVTIVSIQQSDGTRLVVGGVGDRFRAGLPSLTEAVEMRFRRSFEPPEDLEG